MEKSLYRNKKRHHVGNFVLLFLTAVLFIAVYTYILQRNYSQNTLDAAVERDIACSDAIHKVVSNRFTQEDFLEINTREDMDSSRYKQLQESLNELRTLNSTRYLYTAKRGADGKLIYLVDGLDLGADDFAYPGTYIEEEMIPYIESALSGETIYSQEIVDTTWGHIFTACYPVRANGGSGDIIGALCMEIDMESSYRFLEKSNQSSIGVASFAILVAVLTMISWYLAYQKQKEKDRIQQEELEKTAEAAEAANRAKSTFLFNMSHDIRTPMNAIIGYAELAGKHLSDSDKLNEYIKNIQVCGKKMLSIIDNVLELARIENNKAVLEESITKADDSLDSCVIMFQNSIKEKHQELIVDKEIQYPYLYMDNVHVSEIILNILSNAIKYTGEGGKICCSLKQKPYEKEDWCQLEISVADNGIGISEDFQQHIFESFSRERTSTASGIEGTGLGMGIVKKLVDLMKGTIEVESKLGEGSTFTVRIPCLIAKQEEISEKRLIKQEDKKSLAGKRILLAEDNDINAEIAMELLKEEGLILERAENGVICVEKLEKAPEGYYDLILMDVQMPDMDGYDATRKIRRLDDPEKAKIPIIAMTANAFAKDRKMALSSGMDDYVSKPVDMNLLVPLLEKYLVKQEN